VSCAPEPRGGRQDPRSNPRHAPRLEGVRLAGGATPVASVAPLKGWSHEGYVHVVSTGGYSPGDPISTEEIERLVGALRPELLEGISTTACSAAASSEPMRAM
jgi:hypothetical protein